MRPHWIAFMMLSLSWTVFAQNTPPSTITSTGEASQHAAPTHVEFQFSASFEETTLVSSTEKANAFPAQFRETVKTRKLDESQLTFRLPSVNSVNSNVVTVHGTMRFSLPGATDPDDLVLEYAALCDAVAALGKAAHAIVHGPKLIVEDSDLFEQQTLKRATENALYKADAVAQILNTRIYEVRSVEIQELRWHLDKKDPKTAPGLDRLTCTAKVSLTYLHQP